MSMKLDEVITGNCIEWMVHAPLSFQADLVFADPPFNIGYDYDQHKDNMPPAEYMGWCRQWMLAAYSVLRPGGSFWLAIGDEYAAELKVRAQESGFTFRSWVIWHYTFGVARQSSFSRSHTHLLYFVKDGTPTRPITWNADAIRVPSARMTTYGDPRQRPGGKVPDNTWILRPADVPDAFAPDSDTWCVSRVAGTFSERCRWHPCQMPEQVLGRIIRACTNPGDIVLDPFAGSGAALAVAKKLDRQYVGIEISPDYCTGIKKRLESINAGDPLHGSESFVSGPMRARTRYSKGNNP